MQSFIREGHVALQSELPREFHARMHAALEPLDEGGPRGHNNLLPCVPELSRLLDEPVVQGALESILGPGCYLHFHRHDHFNFPNAAQPLHKDGDNHSHYAVDGLRRMHRTRFAMLFYYPQDTPLAKGPTGIVPRSQYVPRRALEAASRRLREFDDRARKEIEATLDEGESIFGSERGRALWRQRRARFRTENPQLLATVQALAEPWEAAKIPLVGKAGTVTIVHFDMVHGRYSGNTTDETRHMVKFLFTRDRDPVSPSWNHRGLPWPQDDDALAPVWRSLWDWHRGAVSKSGGGRFSPGRLGSEDDRAALGAAYSLGAAGDLKALFEVFLNGSVELRTIAAYGLVAAGAGAVSRLGATLASADAELAVRVLDVLGDIGPPAAAALNEVRALTRHEDVDVRRYAVEAMGTVAQGRPCEAAPLAQALLDDDALVRRNAALSVARLGSDLVNADRLVPLLADNLYHWHHHVRGWSIEALQRLPSKAATAAALRYLMAARWDPMPKSGDTPPGASSPKKVVAR